MDGTWLRAFDYGRWDYWASNADAGWGAWCVETGWVQGWLVTVLSLRQLNTTLWDLTARRPLRKHLEKNLKQLSLEENKEPLGPGHFSGRNLATSFEMTGVSVAKRQEASVRRTSCGFATESAGMDTSSA